MDVEATVIAPGREWTRRAHLAMDLRRVIGSEVGNIPDQHRGKSLRWQAELYHVIKPASIPNSAACRIRRAGSSALCRLLRLRWAFDRGQRFQIFRDRRAVFAR